MNKGGIELTQFTVHDDNSDLWDPESIDEELIHLPFKSIGSIPRISYLICFIEFSERFSYYMISGCLTNMIQRGFPKDSITGGIVYNTSKSTETPGALNLGLPLASFTMQFLTFFANISPIISGYFSDSKIGKFKTIYIGTILGIVGHFLLTISSIPFVMKIPFLSFAIILVSVAIIAIAAGTIKSSILPLLLDQYEYQEEKLDFKTSADGRVLQIDHKATLETLSMSFYMWINWGCTLSLFGSILERYYGFWLVYLITALLFLGLPIVLKYLEPRIIHVTKKRATDSNIYLEFYFHLKSYFFNTPIPINSCFEITKDDVQNVLNCIILFMFFIPFYLGDSSLLSIQISLAATMSSTLHLPNDIYQALNPLAIIVLIPVLSYLVYPYLLKKDIMPAARTKIIIGFAVTSIGTLLGAYVQLQVYKSSACNSNNVSNCKTTSDVSLMTWICYLLMFVLQAIGECFAATTCYELAYELSPVFLRSGVLSLFLASVALSSVIGQIFSIWMKDPYLVHVFLFTGILGIAGTIGFAYWSKGIKGL